MRQPRPFVVRKCGEKRAYNSYAEAFRVAKEHWKHYREKMVPYLCPLCGKHHIGHQKTEEDLSTAFVPLRQPKPKQEPKPKKVKQQPPEQIVRPYTSYQSYLDEAQARELKRAKNEANRTNNEALLQASIKRKSENVKVVDDLYIKSIIRKEERQRQHEERMAARPPHEAAFTWWVACDDGWNQHT